MWVPTCPGLHCLQERPGHICSTAPVCCCRRSTNSKAYRRVADRKAEECQCLSYRLIDKNDVGKQYAIHRLNTGVLDRQLRISEEVLKYQGRKEVGSGSQGLGISQGARSSLIT